MLPFLLILRVETSPLCYLHKRDVEAKVGLRRRLKMHTDKIKQGWEGDWKCILTKLNMEASQYLCKFNEYCIITQAVTWKGMFNIIAWGKQWLSKSVLNVAIHYNQNSNNMSLAVRRSNTLNLSVISLM